jgi:putative ABC transport system substrate-binding protein
MAADLVRQQVAVMVADGPAVRLAKAATSTIAIVFYGAADPVASGYVVSLSRPGGNLTGVTNSGLELQPKRLELLHEAVPAAKSFALLANPNGPNAERQIASVQAAGRTRGLEVHVLRAGSVSEFDAVFATLAQQRAAGLVITPDLVFLSRTEELAVLALRHAVPAIFQYRESTTAGGLMSYGGSTDSFRTVGNYVGRILKGEKPADLPVQQATKVELIINLKTAKALGLTVPVRESLVGPLRRFVAMQREACN